MSQENVFQLAQNGNPEAIAQLINKSLQPKGITATVTNSSGCLTVKVRGQSAPEQSNTVSFLKNGIAKLKPANVSRVIVQGFAAEQTALIWRDVFALENAGTNALPTKEQSPTKAANFTTKASKALKSPNSANFSKVTTDVLERTIAFVKTRNGERTTIAISSFLLTSLFWLGVGGLSSHKQSQLITQEVNSNPPSEAASSEAASSPSNDVFTPKKAPILGSTASQLEDQSIVLQLALNGRTTSGLTEIPKSSMYGIAPNPVAVTMGYPPAGTDICNLPYSALIRPMYEQCIKEGMTFNQVSSIVGWEGEETSSSGSSKTYRWGSGGGSMFLTFENNRLISKSQTGLKP